MNNKLYLLIALVALSFRSCYAESLHVLENTTSPDKKIAIGYDNKYPNIFCFISITENKIVSRILPTKKLLRASCIASWSADSKKVLVKLFWGNKSSGIFLYNKNNKKFELIGVIISKAYYNFFEISPSILKSVPELPDLQQLALEPSLSKLGEVNGGVVADEILNWKTDSEVDLRRFETLAISDSNDNLIQRDVIINYSVFFENGEVHIANISKPKISLTEKN